MTESSRATKPDLDFLWLELTNRCNLECLHCYADSGPRAGGNDRLAPSDYVRLLEEAAGLGCKKVQFIGGEPTLNPALEELIRTAGEFGFDFIEVYTNLVHLSSSLLECFRAHRVHVATSVYSDDALVHDSVTSTPGSHGRTLSNLQRLLQAEVPVRVGIVSMPQNQDRLDETRQMLRTMGVESVGVDAMRGFGRGADDKCTMESLCGECAGGTLCVGPDGHVSPCIMSKPWGVGNVLRSSLAEITKSEGLAEIRRRIGEATGAGVVDAFCDPKLCRPYDTCSPKIGPGPCEPTGCSPCFPKG